MKERIYFLGHLRTLAIFLVVVVHAGIVYEPVLENSWIVSWYGCGSYVAHRGGI
ncbi:MAG: hypothetical protein H6564_24695 [Lewinellaceae bacterium]|nr:hypothetical protein [Lewinellaceae bacterium]